MKGKIIYCPFTYTDLTNSKLRPALVIHERPSDLTIAYITSIIPKTIPSYSVFIPITHKEFILTKLKKPSLIRLDKINTIKKSLARGTKGQLGPVLEKECNIILESIFHF